MQCSEHLLADWRAETLYAYAREHDFDLTPDDAHALVRDHFPAPPHGWLVAVDPATGHAIVPVVYWHESDARADVQIYRDDGYEQVEITHAVDDCDMCDVLVDMLSEANIVA